MNRFYQTASVIEVQSEFSVTFDCRKASNRSATNGLVDKFETTDHDSKKGWR
jgi:hypothetical protein